MVIDVPSGRESRGEVHGTSQESERCYSRRLALSQSHPARVFRCSGERMGTRLSLSDVGGKDIGVLFEMSLPKGLSSRRRDQA